jgi:hypothetical protein
LFGSSHPIALDEWLSCRPTATKYEDKLLDDPADIIYTHRFYPWVSLSKSHVPFSIIQWTVALRIIERPKVRSGTAYVPLENGVQSTIPLRKTFVFVTAIREALENVAKRINSS